MGNFSNQAKSLQAPLLLPVRNRRYSPVPMLPGAPHLASKGMGPDSAGGSCLQILVAGRRCGPKPWLVKTWKKMLTTSIPTIFVGIDPRGSEPAWDFFRRQLNNRSGDII